MMPKLIIMTGYKMMGLLIECKKSRAECIKRLQACKKEKFQRVEGLKRILQTMNDARREVDFFLVKSTGPFGSKSKKSAISS
jgi:hypothetical protein